MISEDGNSNSCEAHASLTQQRNEKLDPNFGDSASRFSKIVTTEVKPNLFVPFRVRTLSPTFNDWNFALVKNSETSASFNGVGDQILFHSIFLSALSASPASRRSCRHRIAFKFSKSLSRKRWKVFNLESLPENVLQFEFVHVRVYYSEEIDLWFWGWNGFIWI